MSIPASDGTLPLVFPARERSARAENSYDLEGEVVGLFDGYRQQLSRYALSFGLPIQDAEEIIQEVFLSLYRHLQLGKSRENLRGWIFRVTHNLALKRRVAGKKFSEAREDEKAWEEKRLDPELNPEEQLVSAQRRKRLLAVLQALPEQDQHCLQLRAEGLRYREIAEVLSMSLGAVSISLTRSFARLGRADEQ